MTERSGLQARRARDPLLEAQDVAGAKKITARQRRIIVSIDESGQSEGLGRATTWGPRGETPVLQYTLRWKQLSVIAGTSVTRVYIRLFNGSIKAPQIVEVIRTLSATIGRKILSIWDRLHVHRSKLVKKYVEETKGAIALEYLPPYAPERNPVEYIWAYLKSHAMPNFCARDFGHLHQHATSRLRSMQRRTRLVGAL